MALDNRLVVHPNLTYACPFIWREEGAGGECRGGSETNFAQNRAPRLI